MSRFSEPPGVGALVVESRRGVLLSVRIRPRSSRRGVLGVVGSELAVGVGSAPEGGRATAEALRVVAEWLGLPPSRLTLASGAASRSKRFLVAGETADELRSRLVGRLGAGPL